MTMHAHGIFPGNMTRDWKKQNLFIYTQLFSIQGVHPICHVAKAKVQLWLRLHAPCTYT